MKEKIEEVLAGLIRESLNALGLSCPKECDLSLDMPEEDSFGDYSSNVALRLSKANKSKPLDLAKAIAENINRRLNTNSAGRYIRQIKAEGAGFINFYLSNDFFYEFLRSLSRDGREAFKADIGNNENVLIEFVSANPTGPLSVAHARQAAVGDALGNILSFLGFRVGREYYLNDEGNQINILGDSLELRLKELNGEKIDYPQNYYQGEYIRELARKIEDEKLPVKDFCEYAKTEILKTIKKELDDFSVKFDCWYSQKALRESGKIQQALELIKEKGFLYEEDKAVWFKSSSLGDDKDRVVVKSDGSYTYLAPDIAYHQDKYQRGFKWLINFWGPDHHGYINRLKAAVKALGHNPDSLSIVIVQLATIFKGKKPLEMSTRKGQYITLREVLDEVGPDASRFFFLMRRTSSHLDFDLEAAKKQTAENPVYYVQYAHARICSILRLAQAVSLKEADLNLLKEEEEKSLIKKIWKLSYSLKICWKTQDPYMLTVYLQELAEAFHRFYDRHRVLDQEDKLTRCRIALLCATKEALSLGLELLGLRRPDKM